MAQNQQDSRRLGGSLTLLDAIAQSVGFMGPVFSMAFLVPLVVGIISASGNGAGRSAPLAVVLATIGVLGIGWIISQYARRISAAGSLYDYISDGFGARVGAGFGFVYYVGIMGLGAGLLVLIGGTIHDTLDAEFGNPLLPEAVWDLLLLVLVGVVLYLGVALSTRLQLVLAFASIATVLIFSIFVISKVGSGNNLATAFTPDSETGGLNGVLFGVLYGVLLFTGFETAANLGEETTHPKRDIPRAVLASVLAVAGFYLIVTYAQVAGFGFDLSKLGEAAGGPLFALAGSDGYGSQTVGRLVELMVVLDMIAVLIGVSVSASRGIFALSRDHRLPHVLSGISSRRTPVNASALLVGFYVLVVLVTLYVPGFVALGGDPAPPHYFAVFSWFSTLGSICLGAIYLVMCLGAIRGLSDHPNKAALYLAVAVGTVVMLLALFGAVYKVAEPTIWTAWTALALVAIGFALTWAFPGEDAPGHHWEELTPADQGPTKF